MLAPDWTWFDAIPVLICLVALLWIPGSALAGALGAGRWPATALAPLISTSLVAVGGIVTDLVGLRWGMSTAMFWLGGLPLLAWIARLLVRRSGRAPWLLLAPPVQVWQVLLGLAASIVLTSWIMVEATVAPGFIPQQSDQIFHLGTVRSMLDSGSISSLTADGLNHRDSPIFYPAAFHGITATAIHFTGAPIVVVENSLLLVTCALVYPLGMMFLLNTLALRPGLQVLLTGVFAVLFTAFPWRIMVWGAVWGQVFGSALIPAVLASYGWGLSQLFKGKNWGSAALLFAAAVPSLALGHTSAFFGAVVGALVLSVAYAAKYALDSPRSQRRWLPLLGFVVIGAVANVGGVLAAPEGMRRDYEANMPPVQIAINLATLWSEKADPAQLAGLGLGALALIGVVLTLASRKDWWIAATGLLFLVVVTVMESRGPSAVWHWTWPWYDFGFRVQAVMAIYLLPLVVIGAAWVLQKTARWRPVAAVPLFAVLCLGMVALVVVQGRTNIRLVAGLYQLDGERSWISSDEAEALRELSAVLPDDAVVATSPWRGGQYLYVLGDEMTALPTEKASGEDNKTVSGGLKDMTSDPEVCAAVKRMGITHVITGGTGVPLGIQDWYLDHAAVDEISEDGGFRVIRQSTPYVLWSVPDCTA